MTSKHRRSAATSVAVDKPLTQPAAAATQRSRPEAVQFRYLLAQWAAERRSDGWFIARSWMSSSGEKPKWEGPFALPQDASIAIARYLCAELSNRHHSKARFHRVKPSDPLFGLPPLPDLSIDPKCGGRS